MRMGKRRDVRARGCRGVYSKMVNMFTGMSRAARRQEGENIGRDGKKREREDEVDEVANVNDKEGLKGDEGRTEMATMLEDVVNFAGKKGKKKRQPGGSWKEAFAFLHVANTNTASTG